MTSTTPIQCLNKLSPVIVILGATATGKSKLAISLASKFMGEIISADSMQVYKGLDILTNKVTSEEMNNIPHHMISIVEPKQTCYDVTNFRNNALPLVERILREDKIPIIVGGTNYYIESLLWKFLIDTNESSSLTNSNNNSFTNKRKRNEEETISSSYGGSSSGENVPYADNGGEMCDMTSLKLLPSATLFEKLLKIDPARAASLHPNDKRKILRSLSIFYSTGQLHSDLILEQVGGVKSEKITSPLGGPLRFPNTICLWIQSERDVLVKRINERVEEMVGRGLRQELENYVKILGETSELDFTKGLLQSIGFKEFKNYLQLSPIEKSSERGDVLFNEGVELLKIATRQYAKSQIKWIRQRFLQPRRREVPPVYSLPGTLVDEINWTKNVQSPSELIVENYLSGNYEHPIFSELRVSTLEVDEDYLTRVCKICDDLVLVGKIQYELHITGNKHKKRAKRKRNET